MSCLCAACGTISENFSRFITEAAPLRSRCGNVRLATAGAALLCLQMADRAIAVFGRTRRLRRRRFSRSPLGARIARLRHRKALRVARIVRLPAKFQMGNVGAYGNAVRASFSRSREAPVLVQSASRASSRFAHEPAVHMRPPSTYEKRPLVACICSRPPARLPVPKPSLARDGSHGASNSRRFVAPQAENMRLSGSYRPLYAVFCPV